MKALREAIGADEAMLLAGVLLATVALWSVWGPLALLVPGVVAVWIALPSRAVFVVRPTALQTRRQAVVVNPPPKGEASLLPVTWSLVTGSTVPIPTLPSGVTLSALGPPTPVEARIA